MQTPKFRDKTNQDVCKKYLKMQSEIFDKSFLVNFHYAQVKKKVDNHKFISNKL